MCNLHFVSLHDGSFKFAVQMQISLSKLHTLAAGILIMHIP